MTKLLSLPEFRFYDRLCASGYTASRPIQLPTLAPHIKESRLVLRVVSAYSLVHTGVPVEGLSDFPTFTPSAQKLSIQQYDQVFVVFEELLDLQAAQKSHARQDNTRLACNYWHTTLSQESRYSVLEGWLGPSSCNLVVHVSKTFRRHSGVEKSREICLPAASKLRHPDCERLRGGPLASP